MKKISFATSLLCSALLFGCGDDKGEMSGTNPTTNNTTKTSDNTNGMSSSESATDGTTDPTTGMASNSGTTGGDMTTAGPGGESTGASFIKPTDGGTGTKECDVWTQDCPDGEKCMPYSGDGDNAWESLKCTPVMENAGAVGDTCTVEGGGTSGIDSCEKGAMCWSVDPETGEGTCVEQCKGSPDQPKCDTPDAFCLNANEGVLTLCLPGCDPLMQGCSNGDLCVPNPMDPNSFICVIDASGEEGQEWDACEYANACDAGLLCANPALATECDPQAAGCCLPFCDIQLVMDGTEKCNGANQDCLPWYEEGQAPPGFENVGVCGLPQ
jgi:hypothetical protein